MGTVPEPVTGHVWGSWAEISPAMAESLGLVEGDNIKLTTDAGSIEVGFFASLGIHDDMVAVVMGNGHEGGGRYADLAGANPLHPQRDAVRRRLGHRGEGRQETRPCRARSVTSTKTIAPSPTWSRRRTSERARVLADSSLAPSAHR